MDCGRLSHCHSETKDRADCGRRYTGDRVLVVGRRASWAAAKRVVRRTCVLTRDEIIDHRNNRDRPPE